jgi:competence protein ComEA
LGIWSYLLINPKGGKMRIKSFAIPVLIAVLVLCLSGFSVYAGDAAKININKASAEELTQLKGIGQKYATKIVEYRDQNGPFAAPEDLMKVPGIGPKVLEKNQDIIVVE